MTQSEMYAINQKIDAFNRTTRNEIGVLVVPTLGGDSMEDVAHDVFHSWGIGKAGLDNGILIMIASKDHKMRIEIGKGAEGDIPDAKANEILDGMKAYLRKNDFRGGIESAIVAISTQMEDRTGQKPIVQTTTPGGAPEQTYHYKATGHDNDTESMWFLFWL